MARKVVWSKRAPQGLKAIFDYWDSHHSATFVLDFPQLGKKTNKMEVRSKLVKDYWAVRRNPKHFFYLLKNITSFLS